MQMVLRSAEYFSGLNRLQIWINWLNQNLFLFFVFLKKSDHEPRNKVFISEVRKKVVTFFVVQIFFAADENFWVCFGNFYPQLPSGLNSIGTKLVVEIIGQFVLNK